MRSVLRSIVRRVYRATLPERARSALSAWIVLDERHKPPERITDFAPGPVVVLAPHMDDEAIGCGGAIALHRRAGAEVHVVFTTDGAWGEPALRNRDPALDGARRALTERRKDESRACARVLDVSHLHFLDGPDGALEATPTLARELRDLLRRIAPVIVYVPSVFDSHADHWATCLLLAGALEALPPGAVIREYEVWTPMPITRVADITGVADLKRRAVAVFQSQLGEVDFVSTSMGLAQYRSVHQGGRGLAEGFRDHSVDSYRALMEEVRSRGERRGHASIMNRSRR